MLSRANLIEDWAEEAFDTGVLPSVRAGELAGIAVGAGSFSVNSGPLVGPGFGIGEVDETLGASTGAAFAALSERVTSAVIHMVTVAERAEEPSGVENDTVMGDSNGAVRTAELGVAAAAETTVRGGSV